MTSLNIKPNVLFTAGITAVLLVASVSPVHGEASLNRHKVEAILTNIEYQTWVRRIVEHNFNEEKMKSLELEYMGHPDFGWKTGKDFQNYFLRRLSEIVKQGENYDYYVDPCSVAIYKAIDEVLHDRHLSYTAHEQAVESDPEALANRFLQIVRTFPDFFEKKRWLNLNDFDLALMKLAAKAKAILMMEAGNKNITLTSGKLSKDQYIPFDPPLICTKKGYYK